MRESNLFDKTVVSLYDAVNDVDKWPTFLERLGALFDAVVSQVVYVDFERAKSSFRVTRGLEHVSEETYDRFIELSLVDPLVRAVNARPGKPFINAMLVDRESFESTRVYNEFLKPLGMSSYGRAMVVHLEPSTYVGLGRWDADPPFDDSDVETLSRLVPHLKRAIALHQRLATLELERDDALAGLDAMPLGVVLTDEDGRLRQANRVAREIAARGDGLVFAGDEVVARRRADTARLREAVRKAVRGALAGAAPPAEAISLARDGGAEDYPVVVSALWSNMRKFGPGTLARPLAALFVTDPDRPQEAPADLLQRLYGLTAAEAAVAERLVAGNSLPGTAQALGVSHNTARTHLRRIFDKTGTTRQAELVKKIMETPVWIAARQSQETWRRLQRDRQAGPPRKSAGKAAGSAS